VAQESDLSLWPSSDERNRDGRRRFKGPSNLCRFVLGAEFPFSPNMREVRSSPVQAATLDLARRITHFSRRTNFAAVT